MTLLCFALELSRAQVLPTVTKGYRTVLNPILLQIVQCLCASKQECLGPFLLPTPPREDSGGQDQPLLVEALDLALPERNLLYQLPTTLFTWPKGHSTGRSVSLDDGHEQIASQNWKPQKLETELELLCHLKPGRKENSALKCYFLSGPSLWDNALCYAELITCISKMKPLCVALDSVTLNRYTLHCNFYLFEDCWSLIWMLPPSSLPNHNGQAGCQKALFRPYNYIGFSPSFSPPLIIVWVWSLRKQS